MNHRKGKSIFIAGVDVDDGDGSDGAGGQCGPTEG